MELKSIACVSGAIIINLTLGTFYSIGNLIPYLASYMRNNGNPTVTSEHGAWITAAFLLGQGLFIIIGSFLENKYDSRIACIFGCVIHSTSTFLTIWALNINLLSVILIYGLGSGMGCGSSYMASIIAAQKWFPNSKGICTGIIVAGFGLGGLIFTTLQTMYLNPRNIAADDSRYFNETVYSRVPTMFLYMGIIFLLAQTVGCLLSFPPPRANGSKLTRTEDPHGSTTIVNEQLLPELKSLSSAFGYRIFYLIGVMMMLVAPGVTFVNSLGKSYGQTYIKDDRFLATVVAVSAVANALGRLTWGFLMDKFSFITCYTIKIILFACLIAMFPFGFVLNSTTNYMIWMLGLFFGFSGTFVLFPVFIEQVFGTNFYGIIYGILYIFLALSSILTSLILQLTISPSLANIDKPEQGLFIRLGPCLTIAALYLSSLVLYTLFIPVKRFENAVRNRRDFERNNARDTLFQRQDLFPVNRTTLAEKTAKDGLHKENSLGSIVKFRDIPADDVKIKTLKVVPR